MAEASRVLEADEAYTPEHVGDDHGDHPTEKAYWVVFAVLAVFTAVEVAWSYIGVEGAALVYPLVAMMVVKFILVAGIFMHLKYDLSIRNGSMFTYMFAFGLVTAIAVYAVVLFTFTTR